MGRCKPLRCWLMKEPCRVASKPCRLPGTWSEDQRSVFVQSRGMIRGNSCVGSRFGARVLLGSWLFARAAALGMRSLRGLAEKWESSDTVRARVRTHGSVFLRDDGLPHANVKQCGIYFDVMEPIVKIVVGWWVGLRQKRPIFTVYQAECEHLESMGVFE